MEGNYREVVVAVDPRVICEGHNLTVKGEVGMLFNCFSQLAEQGAKICLFSWIPGMKDLERIQAQVSSFKFDWLVTSANLKDYLQASGIPEDRADYRYVTGFNARAPQHKSLTLFGGPGKLVIALVTSMSLINETRTFMDRLSNSQDVRDMYPRVRVAHVMPCLTRPDSGKWSTRGEISNRTLFVNITGQVRSWAQEAAKGSHLYAAPLEIFTPNTLSLTSNGHGFRSPVIPWDRED